MSHRSVYRLNIVIDDLTNSIRRVDNGESCETEILLVNAGNLKSTTKKENWHFLWSAEFKQNDRKVYKLVKKDQPDVLQGLISLSERQDHIYVHLAENAPINFGPNKLHQGVGGNLFAFACKTSWDKGNEGIIGFQSKTKLINHYEQTLGAIHVGGHQMIIYPEAALILIKQYFKT